MNSPIAVYIHYPYCVKKCPYCDFNSYGLSRFNSDPHSLEREYITALLKDLRTQTQADTPGIRQCRSVFFGGGTPSLMSGASVEQILSELFAVFPAADDIEITLEANPGTIQETLGADKLRAFLAAGVNRISMGVQSFQAEKLKFLGRIHSSSDSLLAVENIRTAGFSNFNLDLMFASANEKLEDWLSDLETACSLEPRHISMYGLTIEPGTDFAVQRSKGTVLKVSEEDESLMYRRGCELLSSAGYERYEISNFAKSGFHCRHNLSYWSRCEYLGLGAGAHGFRDDEDWGVRLYNAPAPHDYIRRAGQNGDAVIRREKLSKEQAQIEFFMLNLRKAEGYHPDNYTDLFSENLPDSTSATIEQLVSSNLLQIDRGRVRLTDNGFLFADSVFEELALSLDSPR